MNKYLILVCLLLTGCGAVSRITTQLTGSLTYKCSRQGVEYVQSDSGLAISVDLDNKPIRCKE